MTIKRIEGTDNEGDPYLKFKVTVKAEDKRVSLDMTFQSEADMQDFFNGHCAVGTRQLTIFSNEQKTIEKYTEPADKEEKAAKDDKQTKLPKNDDHVKDLLEEDASADGDMKEKAKKPKPPAKKKAIEKRKPATKKKKKKAAKKDK